jgi:hypothetical protein
MFDAAMLVPAAENKCLPDQWMKRIGDRDFLRQTPGTMTPLRIAADSGRLPCSVLLLRQR